MTKTDLKKASRSVSFGIDWINGHINTDDVLGFFRQLEAISPKLAFDRWELCPQGIYNYSRRYRWHGMNSIQLAFNPLSDVDVYTAQTKENTSYDNGNFGIFLTLSGSGCRELENLSVKQNCLNSFMFLIYNLGFTATRFDVYLDCFDKNIAPLKVISEAFNYFYEPRVNRATLCTNFTRNVTASKDKQNVKCLKNFSVDNKIYYNYQLGGHGSNTGMFRCYNKLDEQKANLTEAGFTELQQKYGFNDFWYRFEYEVHKERANQAFQACMKSYSDENKAFGIGGLWLSCCLMFFRIVVPKSFGSALRNLPVEDTWNSFLNLVQEIIHFVQLGGVFSFPSIPYIIENLNRFEKHLFHVKKRDLKRDILVRLRPDLNFNKQAAEEYFSSADFVKWAEDVSSKYDISIEEVYIAACAVSA